jgi:hypothetical protein
MESSLFLLDAAAGRDNLLAGAGADLQPAYRDGLRNLAIGEHFHMSFSRADQTGLDERVARNLAHTRRVQPRQIVETHDLRFLTEGIGEPALG